MDYRINNEAIVGCVIAQVVKHGPYEVPFVTGMVNLLMQDKLRRKVLATPGDRVQEHEQYDDAYRREMPGKA